MTHDFQTLVIWMKSGFGKTFYLGAGQRFASAIKLAFTSIDKANAVIKCLLERAPHIVEKFACCQSEPLNLSQPIQKEFEEQEMPHDASFQMDGIVSAGITCATEYVSLPALNQEGELELIDSFVDWPKISVPGLQRRTDVGGLRSDSGVSVEYSHSNGLASTPRSHVQNKGKVSESTSRSSVEWQKGAMLIDTAFESGDMCNPTEETGIPLQERKSPSHISLAEDNADHRSLYFATPNGQNVDTRLFDQGDVGPPQPMEQTRLKNKRISDMATKSKLDSNRPTAGAGETHVQSSKRDELVYMTRTGKSPVSKLKKYTSKKKVPTKKNLIKDRAQENLEKQVGDEFAFPLSPRVSSTFKNKDANGGVKTRPKKKRNEDDLAYSTKKGLGKTKRKPIKSSRTGIRPMPQTKIRPAAALAANQRIETSANCDISQAQGDNTQENGITTNLDALAGGHLANGQRKEGLNADYQDYDFPCSSEPVDTLQLTHANQQHEVTQLSEPQVVTSTPKSGAMDRMKKDENSKENFEILPSRNPVASDEPDLPTVIQLESSILRSPASSYSGGWNAAEGTSGVLEDRSDSRADAAVMTPTAFKQKDSFAITLKKALSSMNVADDHHHHAPQTQRDPESILRGLPRHSKTESASRVLVTDHPTGHQKQILETTEVDPRISTVDDFDNLKHRSGPTYIHRIPQGMKPERSRMGLISTVVDEAPLSDNVENGESEMHVDKSPSKERVARFNVTRTPENQRRAALRPVQSPYQMTRRNLPQAQPARKPVLVVTPMKPQRDFHRKSNLISFSTNGPQNQGVIIDPFNRPFGPSRPQLSKFMMPDAERNLKRRAPIWDGDLSDFETNPVPEKRQKTLLSSPVAQDSMQDRSLLKEQDILRPSSQNTRVDRDGSPMPAVHPLHFNFRGNKDSAASDARQYPSIISGNDLGDLATFSEIDVRPGVSALESKLSEATKIDWRSSSSNSKRKPILNEAESSETNQLTAHRVYPGGKFVNIHTEAVVMPVGPPDPFIEGKKSDGNMFLERLRRSSDERRDGNFINRNGRDPDKTLANNHQPTPSLADTSSSEVSSSEESPAESLSNEEESDEETSWRSELEPHQRAQLDALYDISHVSLKILTKGKAGA